MPCPSQDELTRFLVGDLPRPIFQRLLEHVESCASCTQALQGLEDPADPLLTGLHGIEAVEDEATLPARFRESVRALQEKPALRRQMRDPIRQRTRNGSPVQSPHKPQNQERCHKGPPRHTYLSFDNLR